MRAKPRGADGRPPSVNAQAARMTKAGLMNSDGCRPKIQRREPFTSAPNISAAMISANETTKEHQAPRGGRGAATGTTSPPASPPRAAAARSGG